MRKMIKVLQEPPKPEPKSELCTKCKKELLPKRIKPESILNTVKCDICQKQTSEQNMSRHLKTENCKLHKKIQELELLLNR